MFAMNPMHESEAGKLRKDLDAAKLREASAIRAHADEQVIAVRMQQERDAALSALEIARKALQYYEEFSYQKVAGKALAQIVTPSTALAERDWAQQLKGWQDCLDSVRGSLRGYPDSGGDIEIMREVERIVVDALSHRLIDDDIEESGYLDTPLYPISEKQEPTT